MVDGDSERPRTRRRRVLLALAGLALVGFGSIALTLVVLKRTYGIGLYARPFESEAWTAPDRFDGDRAARRARMVENLVLRHLEPGMARAEVGALLGPGDADPLPAPRDAQDWVYQLGSTPLDRVRIVAWTFEDEDVDSVEGFERAGEVFRLRALRLRFEDERLVAIELVEL